MNSRAGFSFKTLFQIKIFVPLLLTAALLLFAFSITDLPKVMGAIRSISLSSLLMVLWLAAVYLLFKGLEFRLFLRALGLFIPWREMVRAYAIGELCITIPSGIYAQNYVLNRLDATSFARSAAVTTAMLVVEGSIILITLVVLTIPGWPWLRFLILAVFAVAAIILSTLGRFHWTGALRVPMWPHHWIHTLNLGVLKMLSELRHLWTPRTLVPGIVLTSVYLLALVLAFQVIAHGAGITALTFDEAVTIYFFSLAVMMTVGGFLTQVGLIEVAGLGAAQAWGYSLNDAFAVLLGFRIAWTAAMWIVNGALLLWLRNGRRRSGADHLQEPTH